MSNINVEVLLQTQNEKDELFTQSQILNERLTSIYRARHGNPDFKVPLAEIEDIVSIPSRLSSSEKIVSFEA